MYELVSDLCPYIYIDSDSSNYGSSYKVVKYQDNPDDQEHEEVVLVPRRNPRRLIRGDKRELIHIKSDIERSKDKLFSLSTCLPGRLTLHGTWCRWIWTSQIQFT